VPDAGSACGIPWSEAFALRHANADPLPFNVQARQVRSLTSRFAVPEGARPHSMATPRILSGIKPTGQPHLGNYFGMMRPAIDWQEKGEAFYFIADYHALTSVRDPKALREYTRGVALDFLACGLNPAKAVLFRQSDVPEVTELSWILSCVAPMPMLENCHAYKDHVAKDKVPNHGLFAYPVLMAADILIYDSNVVPVGRDQKQHVEVTRDLAQKMNSLYGDVFVVPEASILQTVATIPGLDGQKMSKSYGNTVGLFEEEKAMRKKIMSIVTDSTPVEAAKNPEGSAIVSLYKLVASETDVAQMEQDFLAGGTGYGDFKKRLFGSLWEYFAPMRQRRAELAADPGYIERVLQEGASKAAEVARRTMDRVRISVGLR
jgi:tryptophanyl-tRNA synthetase